MSETPIGSETPPAPATQSSATQSPPPKFNWWNQSLRSAKSEVVLFATSLYRWSSKSSTKWIVMLMLAAGCIAVTLVPSPKQDVLIELRTSLFDFKIDQSGEPSTLVFQGLELQSVTVEGGESWSSNTFGEQQLNGSLAVRSRASSADATPSMGTIRSIMVPPGANVTIKLAENQFEVLVSGAGAQSSAAPLLSIGAGEYWSIADEDRDPSELTGPDLIRVKGQPGRAFQVTGRIHSSVTAPTLIGLQGVRTRSIGVVEPMAPGTRFGVSELLAGTLTFPDIPRHEIEKLWIGERVEGHKFAGVVLMMEYVPGPASPSAALNAEMAEPHLRVVWRGEVEGLRVGHPGGLRDVRPTLLESCMARRGVADYIALATGLLAFVTLLLPKGEEEAAHVLGAKRETAALRKDGHEEQ